MNKRVCALFFFLLCLSFGVLFVKMAELCGGNVSDVAASKNTVGVTVASSRGNIYDCENASACQLRYRFKGGDKAV